MKAVKPNVEAHPFFDGMTPELLDVLAEHALEKEFKPGQVILHQGQSAYQFYLITGGKVVIESYVPNADSLPLQFVGEGDVLGWSWLFPPFNWHFQARAIEATTAIVLDGAKLLVACENNPAMGYQLMSRVAQLVVSRMQSARKRLVQICHPNGSLTPIEDNRPIERAVETGGRKTLNTLLTEHPFLRGMSSRHIGILAGAAMQTHMTAGQLIFREGEMANRFYLLQHGKVLLQLPRTESGEVPIQMLGYGDVLGWSWLVPPFYWHFDALAIEPTDAIFLYGTRLREECETDPDLGYQLMKRVAQVLIQRLQATRRQLLELHAPRQHGRVKTPPPERI